MPGRVRRKSRESYGGDSAWTQEAMEEITATRPALKRASRGRASLAETWALTGREAMSLALTQGRFDRQIEVYTDSLRDELQDSIKRSEAAMKQEMAKLQGMLEAVLKLTAGVAGSSGSRAAAAANAKVVPAPALAPIEASKPE